PAVYVSGRRVATDRPPLGGRSRCRRVKGPTARGSWLIYPRRLVPKSRGLRPVQHSGLAHRALVCGQTFSPGLELRDRKSTRLNSSHVSSSYAVFCLKKKNGRLLPGRASRAVSRNPA